MQRAEDRAQNRYTCPVFKPMPMGKRKQVVFQVRNCLNCFKPGHFPRLLKAQGMSGAQVQVEASRQDVCVEPSVTVSATCISASDDSFLDMVLVQVEAENKIVQIMPLLVYRSQKTLCTKRLADHLGVAGSHVTSVNNVNDRK